jgi:TRAP-type transport system periplasmic protein
MRMRTKNFALAFALVATLAAPARAQVTSLDLVNEYPATSLPGEADTFFADAVKRATDGRVIIRPVPDAKSGLRSRDQLAAVADGRVPMADTFGGALADESPAFLLSSLPFATNSTANARKLYDIARPLYEKLFADRKQKLLYVTPWPPTGLWSSVVVRDAETLKSLKIRTYDKTSTDVFARLVAAAAIVSFADLNAKLETGEINAVLSSGDGGAGRALWKYTRYFSQINYAVPLSFTSISKSAWDTLDEASRKAIEQAARETTEHGWDAMAGRVAENFTRMRENGVVIDPSPPAVVMGPLREAAAASIADWRIRAGPGARQALDDYRATLPQ